MSPTLEFIARITELERQLAEAQGKLERCGQENCLGYQLGDAANWVREERLIEAQGKLEAAMLVLGSDKKLLGRFEKALARILKEGE